MAYLCEGCGERVVRVLYRADGPWAGLSVCRECGSGNKKMTRLSWLVAFRFRVAEVVPPEDPITAPIVRLMMAVDDVRRAQILLIEADEGMHAGQVARRTRAFGDWLYSLKLLFSHVHEAGLALRNLDSDAPGRLEEILAGNREALKALEALRLFFSSADYKMSLIARVRNVIGSHYDRREVAALAKAELSGDTLLESTAASVGGLARMADPIVHAIMRSLNGGDFMMDEAYAAPVAKALDLAGHLITLVDHLFNALIVAHPDAIVDQQTILVDVPPLVARVGEAVQAAREQLQAAGNGAARAERERDGQERVP